MIVNFLMGTKYLFVLKTQFRFLNMGSIRDFFSSRKALFMASFWYSVLAYFASLLRNLFRFHGGNDNYQKENTNSISQSPELKHDYVFDEEETPKFFFKFQSYEDFNRINGGINKDYSSLIEEEDDLHEKVSNLDSNNDFLSEKEIIDSGSTSKKSENLCDEEYFDQSSNFLFSEEIINIELSLQKQESSEFDFPNNESTPSEVSSQELNLDSKNGGLIKSEVLSEKELNMDSKFDSNLEDELDTKSISEESFKDDDNFIYEKGFIDIDLDSLSISSSSSENSTSDEPLSDRDDDLDHSLVTENDENTNVCDDSDEPISRNSPKNTVSEDSNGLESLWEHQDLIEQLKMEIRKVRETGLPTIFEESEFRPVLDDLKPWKIDEKHVHEGRIDELHRIHKMYQERMRKFDIFSYQKMYALGLLNLKDDPFRVVPSKRSSLQTLTSLLSQNERLSKKKTSENDGSSMKFIKELLSDLETVYVGQLCLSWEFLHWQYEKALEIWESDEREVRRYNEIADEFQKCQVLLERFIENEPFQGPRVQTYVQQRCANRILLQVPVIREDSKRARRRKGKSEDEITSATLVEILEETIRIFWRFIRSDKDETRGTRRTASELQDPADAALMTYIHTDLRKKEKKIKDYLRSNNYIIKKLKRYEEEDDSEHELYFFSEVNLKLVGRVVNMSRITTDQLRWCREKLSNISFSNRKIHVDPSLLLFPC